MSVELWQQCVELLRDELPAQQFNTWIRPLQVEGDADELRVYAPNRFVLDWVNEKYLGRLIELLGERGNGLSPAVSLLIGARRSARPAATAPRPVAAAAPAPAIDAMPAPAVEAPMVAPPPAPSRVVERNVQVEGALKHTSYLNRTFTFENFVEGKSNQLARAAAWQVADNPKHGYNPLFLYGGVGLGKTHLMHAVGNHLLKKNPNAKVNWSGGPVSGVIVPDRRSRMRLVAATAPPGLEPSKVPDVRSASPVSPAGHYGYAATWFGLAAVALIIYALALGKRRRKETP